jgi:hypothetical protein
MVAAVEHEEEELEEDERQQRNSHFLFCFLLSQNLNYYNFKLQPLLYFLPNVIV